MDRHTMEPGRMTFNMVRVSNIGMITPNTTEHTIKVTNTDMEATHGQMAPITQVNGFKTESKAKVLTLGKTEEFTQDHGKTITWKVMESTHGLMEEDMKVSI